MNKKAKKIQRHNWWKIYECGALKEYLEKMSQEGFRLESMINNKMTFVPWDGSRLYYDVNIFVPSGDVSTKGQQREDFINICEDSGWEFVCEQQHLYIFCSEMPDLIPVETDENAKFRNIHKRILSENIFTWFLLPIVGIFIFWSLLHKISFVMTDYVGIFNIIIWTFLTMNAILEIAGYAHWYVKSKISLQEHGCVSYRGGTYHKICGRILLVFPLLCFLAFICASAINQDWGATVGNSFLFVSLLIFAKTTGEISQTSKNIQNICCVICIAVAVYLVFFGSLLQVFIEGNPQKEDLTITMEDLGMSADEKERTLDYSLDKTIFASLEYGSDVLGDDNDTETSKENQGVYYEIFRSTFPFFVKTYTTSKWLSGTQDMDIKKTENDAWGTENVYEITRKNENGQAYLIIYENTALEIEVLDESGDSSLSDADIKNIVKKLQP